MDRDTFIITVYCLIEEHYRSLTAACPRRHGGFVPQLSDIDTHYPLLAAPPTHDIQGLATWVDGYTGGIIAAAPS